MRLQHACVYAPREGCPGARLPGSALAPQGPGRAVRGTAARSGRSQTQLEVPRGVERVPIGADVHL